MGFFGSENAPSSVFDPVKDLPDMKGKVILITGASGGIGFASLLHLCRKGAKVYIASSNEERGKEALKRAEREGIEPGMGEVLWHELDLKDPKTAKASAESFLAKESKLDILINNAALIVDDGKQTVNELGFTSSMFINYLGPLVFTQTLLPLLEATAAQGNDVRIINVGSHAHFDVKYQSFDSKEAWNHKFSFSMVPAMARYSYSKLAFHLWHNHFSRRLAAKQTQIMVLVVHPGAIMSDGARRNVQSLPLGSIWVKVLGNVLKPQDTGAYTTVFAACTPRDNEYIKYGAYIVPPNIIAEQSKIAMDEKIQDELFEFTKKVLQEAGVEVQGI
ncbi:hypothetical protein ONZ45_g5295 [Pleurotus djamor]|nr:hypothetical protein ONZ45_g5295 [Pleurotus djamor]